VLEAQLHLQQMAELMSMSHPRALSAAIEFYKWWFAVLAAEPESFSAAQPESFSGQSGGARFASDQTESFSSRSAGSLERRLLSHTDTFLPSLPEWVFEDPDREERDRQRRQAATGGDSNPRHHLRSTWPRCELHGRFLQGLQEIRQH